MTTPLGRDFPDYGRHLSATDQEVFSSAFAINGFVDLGDFYVGNAPYVNVQFSVSSGVTGARLNLDWKVSAGGVIVGTDEIHVQDIGSEARGSVPSRGPFVGLNISPQAGVATAEVRIFAGTSVSTPQIAGGHSTLISQNLVSVANGVTLTVDALDVRWGWALWSAHFESATVFRIRLFSRDSTGATTLIDTRPNGTTFAPSLIFIPPRPLRLEAFNNDGVARNLLATVVFNPMHN